MFNYRNEDCIKRWCMADEHEIAEVAPAPGETTNETYGNLKELVRLESLE